MKLVPCLLFKRPEDSLSAVRRRRRRQPTPLGCAGFVGLETQLWVFEASCGVPENSTMSFDGSRDGEPAQKS